MPRAYLNLISKKFIKNQSHLYKKENIEQMLDIIRTEYNREMKWSFLIEVLKNPKLIHRF